MPLPGADGGVLHCCLPHLPRRYGPFWVASTLIFVTAATGNLASYINYTQQHPGALMRPWAPSPSQPVF